MQIDINLSRSTPLFCGLELSLHCTPNERYIYTLFLTEAQFIVVVNKLTSCRLFCFLSRLSSVWVWPCVCQWFCVFLRFFVSLILNVLLLDTVLNLATCLYPCLFLWLDVLSLDSLIWVGLCPCHSLCLFVSLFFCIFVSLWLDVLLLDTLVRVWLCAVQFQFEKKTGSKIKRTKRSGQWRNVIRRFYELGSPFYEILFAAFLHLLALSLTSF